MRFSYAAGFVRATLESTLQSIAEHPSAITLRVRVPSDSKLIRAVRVDGAVQTELAVTRELRNDGEVFAVDAGSLLSRTSNVIRIEVAARAPMHASIAHVTWPARGNDGRIARTHVRIEPSTASWRIDDLPVANDAFDLDSASSMEIDVTQNATASFTRYADSCDGIPCAAIYAAAPSTTGSQGNNRAREVLILVDASPSMRGPASGRTIAVLNALVSNVYVRARVRVVAFAARTEAAVEERTIGQEIGLDRLASVTSMDLGAATQPEHTWQDITAWIREAQGAKHIVVVTDGSLTQGAGTRSFFENLTRVQAHVNVVLVGNADAAAGWREAASRTEGVVASVAYEADRLQRNAIDPLLPRALSSLQAPIARRISFLRVDGAREVRTLRQGEDWLGYARVSPRARYEQAPYRPLPIEDHRSTPDTAVGRGVPAETVLQMLRQRILPAARACFRSDRRGRRDYAVRATYAFALENREISSIDVSGSMTPALSACLRDTITRLDVPYFEGRVVVRYPLQTRALAPEAQIELPPALRTRIEALFPGQTADELLRTAQDGLH
jgi:hypothetical protein